MFPVSCRCCIGQWLRNEHDVRIRSQPYRVQQIFTVFHKPTHITRNRNNRYAFNETDETEISSMSVYRDVCEKMKLNFGIQTNEKKNSVLLNSMIELLLMSPPRPLLTMLSTSVLILRMLRSKTKKKKLYTMLSTENIRQIRDGHATVAVRILAIVRHWH